MRVEILNTGTELLLGSTLNTHGAWFGQELLKLGIRVSRQTTIPDGDAIREEMSDALGRADVVIVTGGLGPTSDDLTKECLAEVLGLEMIRDEAAMRSMEAFFEKRGKPMVASNFKQADAPVGADVLPNPNGTAPGIYMPPRQGKGCAFFLLPGPPRELYPMFHEEVVPRLRALGGVDVVPDVLEIKFVGVGESEMQERVDAQLEEIDGMEHGYCARMGECDLRLIGEKTAIEKGREVAMEVFGDYAVSDDGALLEEVVVREFAAAGWTLATVESCTGGLIASRVTDVSGSSAVLTHGFVTYANEAKVSMVGVDQASLDAHGAVSEVVAREMAEGALQRSGAEIAVSVTGVAGPTGGTEDKPVGTVFMAYARRGQETIVRHQCHPRGRADFKTAVSQVILSKLLRLCRAES